ncbi:ion channel [Eudoraea chungangensis]|uniref:ion channel n=1 Tax=Eudoraea chungangensis TaxID=1481905 RepID=UPI0023EDC8A0|nr:ion channel [Eudoraea chungangensis]
MRIINYLYPYRFDLFLISLLFILFGTLFVPNNWYDNYLNSIFFVTNIIAGLLLISKKKRSRYLYFFILFTSIILFVISAIDQNEVGSYTYYEFATMFSFYCLVTSDIIHQVWHTKSVNRSVMTGLMSGYICLGLVGFFILMTIELMEPGSFAGLSEPDHTFANKRDDLTYFSYITLLTIGYGEILPVSRLARNATVLIGLLGQFYLVIVTAVVIEKYIRNRAE